MKTVDFVKQNIPAVLEFYALPPITRGVHFKGECPCCGSKKSFRIDNKTGNGDWICKCGAGNIWKLLEIVTGKQFKDLAHEIDKEFGNTFDGVPKKDFSPNQKLNNAMANWKKAEPLKDTNVKEYLLERGITTLPARAVKCLNGNMFAIATDENGIPHYSHETMLDGNKKANVEVQKKLLGLQENSEYANSVAIRLFDVSSTLGIAEGIETALSAAQIYGCNVWSTINSGNMKKFKAPLGVNHLIIFADNDKNGTGLAAAMTCGNKNILSNNDVEKVTIRWTGQVEDFNDMLIDGSNVFEWGLSK